MGENIFKKIQAEREAMLPPDIEGILNQQANTLVMFGKFTDVFGPCAVRTFAMMIGGAPDPSGPQVGLDEWRRKPSDTRGL